MNAIIRGQNSKEEENIFIASESLSQNIAVVVLTYVYKYLIILPWGRGIPSLWAELHLVTGFQHV